MSIIFDDTSLFLVAVLPDPRDLEIARLLGWYRIPLRFAPKVIDVDYLLFYQTKAFGADHSCCIESYAEVQGHELVFRKELFKEEIHHPRSNEEYYKIQIGPIDYLPQKIITKKWYRITFFYTTGYFVNKAENISDLVVRNEERKILWQSLRERGVNSGVYHQDNSYIDNFFELEIEKYLGRIYNVDLNDDE